MFAPRLVERAELPPFRCILSGLNDGPFVDACIPVEAIAFQNPRAYFHPTAVHQLGEVVGMVSQEEHEKTLEALSKAQEELEEVQRELNDASTALDAVDGLTKKGLVIRKQPGRKPKKKEPANVS